MKEIILSRELITPTRAKALLENNTMNRKLQTGWLAKLTYMMKSGQWDENNPATIGISENGKLIDGQHRLQALIIANKRYKFNIVYNLPSESFLITDTGKSRSITNIFEIAGEKNAKRLASIIAPIDNLVKNGYMVAKQTTNSNKTNYAQKEYNPKIVYAIFIANSNMFRKTALMMSKIDEYQRKINILSPAAIGIFYGYVSFYYTTEDVEKYLINIVKGENIDSKSVEFQIRQKLLEIKADPFQKIDNKTAYNMLAHGWNLKLEGKSWSRNKYNGEKVKLLGTEGKIIDYKIVEL